MRGLPLRPVLTVAEAQSALPAVLEEFRKRATADPVVVGEDHKPEAVIVSIELFEALVPLLEDVEIAGQARVRINAGPAESIDDLIVKFSEDRNGPT